MKKVSLAPGKQISISEISKETNIEEHVVLDDIQRAVRDHYFRFGNQAFQIIYDPLKGSCIRNTSVVGVLKTPQFILELLPKIENIDIGKCLGLAQIGGMSGFTIGDSKLQNIALQSDKDVSLIDFFGYSLLDSMIKISHNGIITANKYKISEPSKLNGSILFNETILNGKSFIKPLVSETSKNIDILPNQIIKTALKICLHHSRNEEMKNLASSVLYHFDGVKDLSKNQIDLLESISRGFSFTSPRPDYETALSHALAIFEGGSIDINNEGILNSPSFTLDLDVVFESFCSFQLKNIINSQKYTVNTQAKYAHKMVPNISSKKIVPDIVIIGNDNEKGVIIDLKNKYSKLREDGKIIIDNADLYQISYYAKTLGIKNCILVYPSSKPRLQYPLKSSESETAYLQKRKNSLKQIIKDSSAILFEDTSVRIILYNVDLAGPIKKSVQSVAGLGQMVTDIINENE